jgi:hypothetical protein
MCPGEWFYEYALGLRYRHRRAMPRYPRSSPCAIPGGLSPALMLHTLRLSDAELCALHHVAALSAEAEMYGHGKLSWSEMRNAADATLKITSAASSALLTPEAALILDAHIVPALRGASGHLDTIYGRIQSLWKYTDKGVNACPQLTVSLSVPVGLNGSLFLPRSLLAKLAVCAGGAESELTVADQTSPERDIPILPILLNTVLSCSGAVDDIACIRVQTAVPIMWVTADAVFEQNAPTDVQQGCQWLRIDLAAGSSWAVRVGLAEHLL